VRIRLDHGSGVPLWTQVADAIARLIERGRLLPGDRLPSVRELALELDLAPNTVARAYRWLRTEGRIEGRGRHGTFVSASAATREAIADLREAAESYVRRARRLGFGSEAARREVERALRGR